MSGTLIMIVQFLMALSLLIVLHEGGHFFFARLFKTRVEKFYLFFDFLFPFSNVLPFSLFKKKIGETQWGIGWFPLGGYVKIAGMVDESMDKEQLAKPAEPWEFRSKKPWQRLLIMLGGIIVNVLLAFVIYAMVLFVWGERKILTSSISQGVMVVDSLGYKIGFKDGDKIVSVDGKQFRYFNDQMTEILYAKTVTVNRNGQEQTITLPEDWKGEASGQLLEVAFPFIVDSLSKEESAYKAGLKHGDQIIAINNIPTPYMNSVSTLVDAQKNKKIQVTVLRGTDTVKNEIAVNKDGRVGISAIIDFDSIQSRGFIQLETKKYSLGESFPGGVTMGVNKIKSYWRQLGLIVNFKNKTYKQVGGFASMAKIYGTEWDWQRFWSITAFISIALAIMNLLPIPGLDGGYVVFTLIEMIIGRKVNEKVVEVATTIGLVLLLILMVLVNGHDIFKMFK